MSVLYIPSIASNLISTGTLSSSSADSNFPLTNLGTGFPFKVFRFNSAGTDDTITIDLGSSQSATFASIHGHNVDSGITALQLRKSTDNFSANDVLVDTFTVVDTAMYVSFNSTSSRYWRLKFTGTNTDPIWIGEWVLGVSSSLTTNQEYGWSVGVGMPQVRVTNKAGQILATNLSNSYLRELEMEFISNSESDKNEVLALHVDSYWGQEPIVIVPDSNDEIVVHGRVSNAWKYKLNEGVSTIYTYGLTVVEDPLPVIVT